MIETVSPIPRRVESFNLSMLSRQLKVQSNKFLNCRTIVGVKCKDGVVLGAEKLVFSKLLVDGTNKRIYNVDKSIGMVVAGKIPDGRHIMNYARNEANSFEKDFDINIDGRTLAERLALYKNAYTLANAVRPYGSS